MDAPDGEGYLRTTLTVKLDRSCAALRSSRLDDRRDEKGNKNKRLALFAVADLSWALPTGLKRN